LLYG
jgi:hypothetical protein